MTAVEIEEAISQLAEAPFDPLNFPYAFLEAFGNKATTIKRLRSGTTNPSDLEGGVLQRNHIHLAVCDEGQVADTLDALRESPATSKAKASFILATDGIEFQAENLGDGETVACDYPDFHNHFGFFLPLAGITTVKEIRENAFDIKATSRLNKLYTELLNHNPDWATAERREDMNHFMARLIFCFFAEDTDIFQGGDLFTGTVEMMSERDSSNTHEIIAECFRAMNTPHEKRAGLRNWATKFPYVNGGLFAGGIDVPKFSKIARSYLLHVGSLDWTKINPDIFGSMIQAVADDEERGSLGMHYTSVPNILKVLNPLFLDELRAKLEEAGDGSDPGSKRKLLNLRNRIARIRVFDPACGSGNFLVIAYRELRAIEAEINERRGEHERRSDIPLTNFRGIEIRHFSAEIARLALVIAEYQCDVRYLGQKEALAVFLPLSTENWIACGNALRLDWLSICPPTGTSSKARSEDFFDEVKADEIDFENEGGETFICGNPPYIGRRNQTKEQKADLKFLFHSKVKSFASLDYVFCWIEKASEYAKFIQAQFAFVTTNSVSQGTQIPIFWPYLLAKGLAITFAHRSFKWSNNASHNAGVTVVIIGIGRPTGKPRIFEGEAVREVDSINPYLLSGEVQVVKTRARPISDIAKMNYGNLPGDGNHLSLGLKDKQSLLIANPEADEFVLPLYGAQEFIRGLNRFCLWINDEDLVRAEAIPYIRTRIERVRETRIRSKDPSYNALASRPHQYRDRNVAEHATILAPQVSSESRGFLPTTLLPGGVVTTNQAFALYDAPLWNMALIASKLHLVWIATVCGKLKTDYRYSNTLGWNTVSGQQNPSIHSERRCHRLPTYGTYI